MAESILPIVEKALGVESPPPSSYFPRPKGREIKHTNDINTLSFQNQLATQSLLYEWFAGDERSLPRTAIDYLTAGDNFFPPNLFSYWREAVTVSGAMRLSGRIANGWKIGLIEDFHNPGKVSRYGILANLARNSGSPHAHPHERRMSTLQAGIILGVRELRHGELAINTWIPAITKSAVSHDQPQAIREYLNTYDHFYSQKENKLKTKIGHAAEAALISWITKPLHAFEAQLSDEGILNRNLAAEALYNLQHDEPMLASKRFEAKTRAGEVLDVSKHKLKDLVNKGLDGPLGEFLEKWQNAEINAYSMTFPHIWLLMIAQQQQAGFKYKDSKLGLFPWFEKDWTQEINKMFEDNTTLGEYLNLKDDNDKKAFELGSEVVNQSDLGDMIIPIWESLTKMFKVRHSQERAFFKITGDTDKMVDLITTHPTGNFSKEETSDTLRALWEAFSVAAQMKGSVVSQSRYHQKQFVESALVRMFLLKELGAEIMQGDFDAFKETNQARIDKIHRKALRRILDVLDKQNKRAEKISVWGQWLKTVAKKEDKLKLLVKLNKEHNVQNLYEQKVREVEVEPEIIRDIFANKPDNWEESPRVYHRRDIEFFQKLVDACIDLFAKKHHISKAKQSRLKTSVGMGKISIKTPYKSPDSIAHPLSARTLIDGSLLTISVMMDVGWGAIKLDNLYEQEFIDMLNQRGSTLTRDEK